MHIPIFEAKNRLSALVGEVERGTEITLTRRGVAVAVARLVPVGPAFDREKARRAAQGLRDASRGNALGGIALKDLIDDGRS